MAQASKNYGPSLLQKNPSRDAMLEKMRSKLASTVPVVQVREAHRKDTRNRTTATWTIRLFVGMLIIGANFLFFQNKAALTVHLGLSAVPPVPAPKTSLSVDEQALYWTYALYDIKKFRSHFRIDGYPAIDQKRAKAKLEDLLPKVEQSTLGIISAYMPIVYRTVEVAGTGL